MRILLLIVPLWLLGAPCNKCALNKAQMKCEYYVVKMKAAQKSGYCHDYAAYLDKTKVYGRAAWYYLLGGDPKNALQSAQKALKIGEGYAKEYMAFAYWLLGQKNQAKKVLEDFHPNDLTKKDQEIIERLYNTKINLKELQ